MDLHMSSGRKIQFLLHTYGLYVVTPSCILLVFLEIIPPYDDIIPFLAIAGIKDAFNGSSLSLSSKD